MWSHMHDFHSSALDVYTRFKKGGKKTFSFETGSWYVVQGGSLGGPDGFELKLTGDPPVTLSLWGARIVGIQSCPDNSF